MTIIKSRDNDLAHYDRVLQREIKRTLPDAEAVSIAGANEVIYAIIDGILFKCNIGSDDDDFYFYCAEQDPGAHGSGYNSFCFPIPKDYYRTVGDVIDELHLTTVFEQEGFTEEGLAKIRSTPISTEQGKLAEQALLAGHDFLHHIRVTMGKLDEYAQMPEWIVEVVAGYIASAG
jgi:hypothetical protein